MVCGIERKSLLDILLSLVYSFCDATNAKGLYKILSLLHKLLRQTLHESWNSLAGDKLVRKEGGISEAYCVTRPKTIVKQIIKKIP